MSDMITFLIKNKIKMLRGLEMKMLIKYDTQSKKKNKLTKKKQTYKTPKLILTKRQSFKSIIILVQKNEFR